MTDAATTEHEAAKAHDAVRAAEADIASGRRQIKPSVLVGLVTRARHADLTARAERDAAEQRRLAARRTALLELGEQIDEFAGRDPGIGDALREAAAAVAKATALAAEWDAGVASLADAARALNAAGPVPGGVRSTDESIAVDGATVQHGPLRLVPLGPQLAAANILRSDLESVGRALHGTQAMQPQRRRDHYMRGHGGMIIAIDGDLTENHRAQVKKGDLTPLTEPQIHAYLDGEPIPADHYLMPVRGGDVIEVYGRVSPHYQKLLTDGILRELTPAEGAVHARGGGRSGG